jgi:hypothetical protein
MFLQELLTTSNQLELPFDKDTKDLASPALEEVEIVMSFRLLLNFRCHVHATVEVNETIRLTRTKRSVAEGQLPLKSRSVQIQERTHGPAPSQLSYCLWQLPNFDDSRRVFQL